MLATHSDTLTLTADQEKALDAFFQFLLDPAEPVFVLRGYSGCGKSTLVKMILDRIGGFMKTARLLDPNFRDYEIAMTATTNKAAENLGMVTGWHATTIHSFLGIRVHTDYKTGKTELAMRVGDPMENYLLFIDEASYIDHQLLGMICAKTRNCKLVFIGDPAQLTPVKAHGTPVFDAKFPGAELTEVVRQAEGHPIIELSTKFRHTVNTGQFFSFKPDGHYICHVDRLQFNQGVMAEFCRPGWSFLDSKVLAWTNKCVINYNQMIRKNLKGDPDFKPGDYAICNSYTLVQRSSIKTDQMVHILRMVADHRHGVPGYQVTLDGYGTTFFPASLAARNARLKQAHQDGDMNVVAEIEETWIDLRGAYACTINKAQGSTFDRVFIDLDDIRRCNSGDQIARMLYVGVSRARHQVILTGDLV